jgi:hypothetical protein
VATPETSNRSPIDLKNQLQVALAGAIGLTAGTILWEAIFLHGIGSLIERFADWIRVILLGGSITLAWAHGMSRSPQRAARFGALTGAIVGGAIDLVFWIFGETPCQARSRQIDSTILYMFSWGFCGFLGGLAIERGWGSRSATRVALGVGIAGVVAAFIHANYAVSTNEAWLKECHREIFDGPAYPLVLSDLELWKEQLGWQFLRAAGWALGLMLFAKSDDVLQRQEARQQRHGNASQKAGDSLSQEEIVKIPTLKDQGETFFVATIGITAGLIFSDSISTSGMFSWNFFQWIKYLFAIGFALCLNFRYLDPFLERLGGSDEHTLDSGSRFRKVSLLSVSAAIPVTIFMQLNDKVMMDNPIEMILWVVGAFSGGAITFAWARGSCRSPRRTAEFGALTGAILPSLSILGIYYYAIMLGRRTFDDAVLVVGGAALEWGLYGLLGGLAIERNRETRLPLRVAFGVVAAGLIVIGTFVVASFGILGLAASIIDIFNPESWPAWTALNVLIRVFFVAVGWAWGLTLFPKSDDVLKPRKEREDLDCVTLADQ